MTTVNELLDLIIAGKVKFYKDAWSRGYISRKSKGHVENYKGKYGTGYVWHKPTTQSTYYHIIEYYLIPKRRK